jgi:hypothetical protein
MRPIPVVEYAQSNLISIYNTAIRMLGNLLY